MRNEDELRDALASLDPTRSAVPPTAPSRERLEDVMATTTNRDTGSRTKIWLAAAAVAVVVAGVGIVASLGGDGGATPTTAVAAPPLELNLGDGGAMASCLAFEVGFLADMPVAFEGTVTGVDGDAISLNVDHWYKGGDATTVELNAPQGLEALIGGIDFVAGEQYLISAAEGNVNYCGYSGPSTDEFRAAFDQAFAG